MGVAFRHQNSVEPLLIFSTRMSCGKVDDGLKKEIEAGATLKDVPSPEVKINTHDVTLFSVENFKKDSLKDVETIVKNPLPKSEDIAAEKAAASYGVLTNKGQE